MKKKLLSVLLAMVLLLTCIPMGALSVSAATSGGFSYYVEDGYATIFGYSGSRKDVVIPDKLGGYPVTTIDSFAFCGSKITNVTFGKNIKTIGGKAFCDCSNLTEVVLPNGLQCIESSAFMNCENLTRITIPQTVTTIGYLAFFSTPIKNVTYMGSQSMAKKMTIEEDNEPLLNAKWNYNACKTHTYKRSVTKATATANGSIKYVCEKCKNVSSKVTTLHKASKVKLSKTTYTYNGKVQKPSVVVKDSKGKTIAKSNYTVKYASGRKNVGTYKVTVTFKGKYKGTKTLTFKIIPRAASINKLTAKSKAIGVKLNRSLKQSTGYQIQYSTSSAFKTYKSAWITNYNKNSKTLSGLKAKTTYYVRVRTYKKIGDKFYYSNWATVKKIKTK